MERRIRQLVRGGSIDKRDPFPNKQCVMAILAVPGQGQGHPKKPDFIDLFDSRPGVLRAMPGSGIELLEQKSRGGGRVCGCFVRRPILKIVVQGKEHLNQSGLISGGLGKVSRRQQPNVDAATFLIGWLAPLIAPPVHGA